MRASPCQRTKVCDKVPTNVNNNTSLCVSFLFDDLAVDRAFGKSTRPKPNVTVSLPCNAQGQYAADRLAPKNDPSPIPSNKSAIQKITPSQIYAWPGTGTRYRVTRHTETRLSPEQKWYPLTGHVVDIRLEADGDIG
jgi:hypothetical protein